MTVTGNTLTSPSDNSASIAHTSNILFQDNVFTAGNLGPLIDAVSASFAAGSTGNVDLSGGAPRCSFAGVGSGTVEFTDGNHCSY